MPILWRVFATNAAVLTFGTAADAREAVRGSLREVRAIASRLRPEALDDLGLNSAPAALANDVARQTGLSVERSLTPVQPPLSAEEELVVYRVAQETLTNAARTTIRLKLR